MKKELLERWLSLFREVETDFKSVLDFLRDRRCPVCGSHTPDLQQESGMYPCPENERHGFLEFRKGQKDFFCHHCKQSLWKWEEGAKYCSRCKLPFEVIPLMEAAEKLLPLFQESVPAPNGTGVHPHTKGGGFLGRVRAKLGL